MTKKRQSVFDLEMIRKFYSTYKNKVMDANMMLNRSMTYAEKILYAHMKYTPRTFQNWKRGQDYVNFWVDRVAMQDATAQMALLQFMTCGRKKVAVPTTVHCDHLILADLGAKMDLETSLNKNKEVFDFLRTVSQKYGIGFWQPGAGIIHQILLENYAFPGGLMIGTDSHTVNAGGLGMLAIGVGGIEAVDPMIGMSWELKMPKLIGVKLTGKLRGWASPKDVILKVAGILTVKGGTGSIVEYFGPGAESMSATGKGTICNMGAEIGATTSTFGYDKSMAKYLRATGRSKIAAMCNDMASFLTGDDECYANPEKYFDQVIEIDLSKLEPHINGPFTPDLAWPLSKFAAAVKKNKYPATLEVGLIGSCTNSSYEDMTRAASVAENARKQGLDFKCEFVVTPGSETINYTTRRDGILQIFESIGGTVLANACGPCIGQWSRHIDDAKRANSIMTSFNRNFTGRNDGNPNTHAFVASPEIVTAFAIAGDLSFNPRKDKLVNNKGEMVKLSPPRGTVLPKRGFDVENLGYVAPAVNGESIQINLQKRSKRIQLLKPFKRITANELCNMRILVKTSGKCTTDHISMAGPWLKYRGHLPRISNNCLIGATNEFNWERNKVLNMVTGKYMTVPASARVYRKKKIGTIVFGEENYGEGSSREHAAMEPRYIGVKAVVVKSFARIHESNLKKQGLPALTFVDPNDYAKIRQDDTVGIQGMDTITPGSTVYLILQHADLTQEVIELKHTYNEEQIEYFRAGSALNLTRKSMKKNRGMVAV